MNQEIFHKEIEKIVEISKDYGAKRVLLFGSCLDDIAHARDIDIAVSGIRPKDFFKYYGKLSLAIDDAIDVVDLDDIRQHFYKRIIPEGKVLYETK